MSEAYKSNGKVSYTCHYHVVWCPKDRRKVLVQAIEARLKQIIGEVCQEQQFAIHHLMKLIKGRSSCLLRQEFPVLKRKLPTLWTNSYFVTTTGGASLSVIKAYSEQQKHI